MTCSGADSAEKRAGSCFVFGSEIRQNSASTNASQHMCECRRDTAALERDQSVNTTSGGGQAATGKRL